MVLLHPGEPPLATVGDSRPFARAYIRVDKPVAIVGCHDWPRINSKYYFVRGASDSNIVLHLAPSFGSQTENGGCARHPLTEVLMGQGTSTFAA